MSTDFNGENYHNQFMGALVSFVAEDQFQSLFEKFFLEYAIEFTNEDEHKLRYYEIYQKFQDLFDGQLELFCNKMNISQKEFMKFCTDATVEDPKSRHYLDILLSSVEYETFVKLMRLMRHVAVAKSALHADSKSDSKSTAEVHSPSKSAKGDDDNLHAEEKPATNNSESKTEKGSK